MPIHPMPIVLPTIPDAPTLEPWPKDVVPGSVEPLFANPYYVYHTETKTLQHVLKSNCQWLDSQQAQMVRDFLDIPPEFGDPVLAIVMCALGWKDSFQDGTQRMPGLCEILGDDASHAWRCSSVAFKLWHAVNLKCLKGNVIPGYLPLDWNSPYELVSWAEGHGISLTASGAEQAVDCLRKEMRAHDAGMDDPDVPLSLYHSMQLSMYYPDEFRTGKIRSVIPDGMDNKGLERDGLFQRMTNGWTPALAERLRAAMRKMGLEVEDTPPARTQQANEPDSTNRTPKKKHSKDQPGRPRKYVKYEAAVFGAELAALKEQEEKRTGIKPDNNMIFQRLLPNTVSDVDFIKKMRANYRKYYAIPATNTFTQEYLRKRALLIGNKDGEMKLKAQGFLKDSDNYWRAFLEGGYKGDWTYLERILDDSFKDDLPKKPSRKTPSGK